jgi:hypothetical protein
MASIEEMFIVKTLPRKRTENPTAMTDSMRVKPADVELQRRIVSA